nr:MAG TPA: hypothetical protein [Caudoviricetes sp.]
MWQPIGNLKIAKLLYFNVFYIFLTNTHHLHQSKVLVI